jgi:hypothetical protein
MTIQAGTGNVGIGTTTPGAKLEVAGDVKVTGDRLQTAALGRITPFLVRGTGWENPGTRMLTLGSTVVYNVAAGRGLTLTILRRSDHGVVSTTTYDTAASPAAADNLATALNGMTRDHIGVLTSYDDWELYVSPNLRAALPQAGAVQGGSDRQDPWGAVRGRVRGGRVRDERADGRVLGQGGRGPAQRIQVDAVRRAQGGGWSTARSWPRARHPTR